MVEAKRSQTLETVESAWHAYRMMISELNRLKTRAKIGKSQLRDLISETDKTN